MRWSVDGHAGIEQPLADSVDVVDAVGQVPEIAAFTIFLGIPVVRQLDLRFFIPGRRQEHERESPLLAVVTPELNEPQLVAVKIQRVVEIADADHRVQVFHGGVRSSVELQLIIRPQCRQASTPEFMLHRIRAITLDLDNTLWAIDPVIRRAEAALWEWLTENYPRIPAQFSAEGLLEVRESVMEEHWDKSHDFRFLRKKVLEKIAVDSGYTAELVEPAFAVFDHARNQVDLYPDVMPGLEMLASSFVLVAVTNGNANLETIGIRYLFHDVVAAAEVGYAKPARPIFDQAIASSGCPPAEILHVGDHPETDIQGARDAGLRTAWINRNNAAWPDDLPEPDAVVTTIPELQELLRPAVQRINKAT